MMTNAYRFIRYDCSLAPLDSMTFRFSLAKHYFSSALPGGSERIVQPNGGGGEKRRPVECAGTAVSCGKTNCRWRGCVDMIHVYNGLSITLN